MRGTAENSGAAVQMEHFAFHFMSAHKRWTRSTEKSDDDSLQCATELSFCSVNLETR